MLSLKPAHNLYKGQMEINSFPGEALLHRTAQMQLVWYHWVPFVELLSPEGQTQQVFPLPWRFPGRNSTDVREELGSSACGWRHAGSLNLQWIYNILQLSHGETIQSLQGPMDASGFTSQAFS